MNRLPSNCTWVVLAPLVAPLGIAANARASDGGGPGTPTRPVDACLAGDVAACEEAASIAEAGGRTEFAAHLRAHAATLVHGAEVPPPQPSPRAEEAPRRAVLPPVVTAPTPRRPRARVGSHPASSEASGVRILAMGGAGLLTVAVSGGLGFALGRCGGFCFEPLILGLVLGALAMPLVEYGVGTWLGGSGTIGGTLLGTLVGLLAGIGVPLVALPLVGFSNIPLVVGIGALGALCFVLGPAVGFEISSPSTHVALVPLAGGGAVVLSQRF